jgi:hypothetical protein
MVDHIHLDKLFIIFPFKIIMKAIFILLFIVIVYIFK